MNNKMIEPARELPISDSCDVLVCGGGIAGIAAALAAARQGAKVLLLEREFMLGGLATLGLVTIYLPLCDGCGHQVSFGIAEELLKLSVARGIREERYCKAWLEGGTAEEKAASRYQLQYNPHIFAVEAEQLLIKSGVKLLYGTIAAQTIVENDKISAVIVENKSGRSAISVKSVIDCTGDADICKLSDAGTVNFGQGNVLAAWYYRWTQEKGVQLKMLGASDIPDKHKTRESKPLVKQRFTGLDAHEISDMVVMAHAHSFDDLMAFRGEHPEAIPAIYPTIPQLRMTRRIDGIMTPDDTDDKLRHETSIGMVGDWRKRGPVYELPFGCLFGKKIRNLITAGRNISVTDAMWDITRVIPVCAVTGEAAGIAAAISDDFVNLDVKTVQAKLREGGVKLHCEEVL